MNLLREREKGRSSFKMLLIKSQDFLLECFIATQERKRVNIYFILLIILHEMLKYLAINPFSCFYLLTHASISHRLHIGLI